MTTVSSQRLAVTSKTGVHPMLRSIVICLLLSVLLFTISSAEAQQPKKVPRIGYLSVSDAATESAGDERFRVALRELGYIEGQNITIEYRYLEGKPERAAGLAAELVRLKVDVIVAAGGPTWVQAAKNATKTIPIVMVGRGADPVQAGLVESLARPAGNVTGITTLSGELGGKRLELLKELVPKVARVAVLYDPVNPVTVQESKKILQVAARTLGLTVQFWEVRSSDEFGLDVAGGGAKPANLPVEQPVKFEFIINLKAAKQIGLTIPPNVLTRADSVIR
jgi:ABC-type uncharacterized transport system substrate-binding protein